jgi:septal ring factor EnvC (AmiA/AmiB activator)
MRRINLFLSVIISLGVIYLIIINHNNYANINYIYSVLLHAQSQAGITDTDGGFFTLAIRVSTYTIIILLAGIYVGAGTVSLFLAAQNEKIKAYKRELEKTSISGMTNASKVEVLEAKIKTLEKALTTVMDERAKLDLEIKNLNAEIENLNK